MFMSTVKCNAFSLPFFTCLILDFSSFLWTFSESKRKKLLVALTILRSLLKFSSSFLNLLFFRETYVIRFKGEKNLADPKISTVPWYGQKGITCSQENVFGGYKRLFSIKFFRCFSFLGFSNLIRDFSKIYLSYI